MGHLGLKEKFDGVLSNSSSNRPNIAEFKDFKSMEGHDTELLILRKLSALLLLHIPLIIVTNTVVIVTYIYYSKLHTPGNLILTLLSITDLINGLVNIPIIVIDNFGFRFFRSSKALCFLRYAPVLAFAEFSGFMLLVLCVDRYLALSRPFWYNGNVTNWTVFYAVLFDVGVVVLYLTGYGILFDYDKSIDDLIKRCNFKDTTPIWLNTHIPMALLLIKLLISLLCSFYVANTLWKKIQDTRRSLGSMIPKNASEKEKTNGKITIILMFLYIVLLLPLLSQLIQKFPYNLEEIFNIIVDHLRFANCSVNALVYAIYRKTYRKAYKYILTNRPRKWRYISLAMRDDDNASSWRSRTIPSVHASRNYCGSDTPNGDMDKIMNGKAESYSPEDSRSVNLSGDERSHGMQSPRKKGSYSSEDTGSVNHSLDSKSL